MRLALACLLAAGRLAAGASMDELNWLRDPGFRDAQAWGRAVEVQEGPEGKPAATVMNKERAWAGYSQKVALPQPPPKAMELGAWVRTRGVRRGEQDWEKARVNLVFYDAQGERAGDWPSATASLEGDQDWALYSTHHPVPAKAASVAVSLTLQNAVGQAWFAAPVLLAYDHDGQALAPGQASHPSRRRSEPKAGPNLLLAPGFESPDSRDWDGGDMVLGGRDSLHALAISSPVPVWRQARQKVFLQGRPASWARLSGWLKTKGVVEGAEGYMQSRLGLDFRDAKDGQLGGWQASAAEAKGDAQWTFFERRYPVPAGTEGIEVFAGLGNCSGQAWYDDLSLELFDAAEKPLLTVVRDQQVSDTSDWWAYQPAADPAAVALDLSAMNEAPAGKRGPVRVKDGHFALADGTRVRFWGTDIVAGNQLMEKAGADATARRLARLGVNMIRLHASDATWSKDYLFDPASGDTLSLRPEMLDRYHYLIAALKKNGIYIYPDWTVSRRFKQGDGVADYEGLEDGAKGAIHFDPRLIELNQRFAAQLLGSRNPYTGLALKDDPAYFGNDIVNESSIFTGYGEHKFPEYYWRELQGMYKAWGGKGKITRFRYDSNTQSLVATANPENSLQSLKFLSYQMKKSNLQMKAFQRGLSPHGLLSGSNMGLPVLGSIEADSVLDFMDTHAYWDHPQIWNVKGGWADVARAPFNNQAQLFAPFTGALIPSLAQAAVEGKPLLVTEWNACFPNEYRLEGPLLMAAYACLQDWDGLQQFDYTPAEQGLSRMTPFNSAARVDNEPLFQLGALIFRLGLLKPSGTTVLEQVPEGLHAPSLRSPFLFDHPWLPYAVRVAKRFHSKAAPPDPEALPSFHNAATKTIQSSTGEIKLDYGQGRLWLNSARLAGAVGALGGAGKAGIGPYAVDVAARNPWVALVAVSLDGQPLHRSKQQVLAAVARAENTGQVYNATRTALKEPGEAPVLMQGVQASLELSTQVPGLRVRPLGVDGKPGPALASRLKEGVFSFNVSPQDRASLYLIDAP